MMFNELQQIEKVFKKLGVALISIERKRWSKSLHKTTFSKEKIKNTILSKPASE